MRYSTVKDLLLICDNKELQSDFDVDSTRECFMQVFKRKQFFKAYLVDIREDVKSCIQDIREDSFLSDIELTKSLLVLKNDISLHLKSL